MTFRFQKGAATLIFSILILLIISFVSLYTAKSIVTETKITNNEIRGSAAFEAAQAGVELAISRFKDKKRPTPVNPNGFFDNAFIGGAYDGSFDAAKIIYYEVINDPTSREISSAEVLVECFICEEGVYKYLITSTGFSDDRSSSKTITVFLDNKPVVDNVPDNPLITKGNIVMKGSADVYNHEGASSIWSGGAVDFKKVATKIANPSDPNYPDCLDSSFTCETVSASNGDQGIDIIPNDKTLASYNDEELFLNFFGQTYTEFKTRQDIVKYSEPSKTSYDKSDIYPASGTLFKETIWVDGDLTLNGGVYGCDATTDNAIDNASLPLPLPKGSTECSVNGTLAPVTIVVDGNLSLAGQAQIYGLVFVFGDIDFKGNPDVVGAVITDGEVSSDVGGTPEIWFNSDVLKGSNDATSFSPVSGGWRDF